MGRRSPQNTTGACLSRRTCRDRVFYAMSGSGPRLVGPALVTVLLNVHVHEIVRADAFGLEEAPALHPLVSTLPLICRDRRRVDQIKTARAQVLDLELIDGRIELAIVVDEVVHEGRLV